MKINILEKNSRLIKITAMSVGVLLLLWLLVGSWQQNMQSTQEDIEKSSLDLVAGYQRQEYALNALAQFVREKTPQEKQLIATLQQIQTAYSQIQFENQLLLGLTNQPEVFQQYFLTSEKVKTVAVYCWQKSELPKDGVLANKLRDLFAAMIQIQQSQKRLNEGIKFYNSSLRRPMGRIFNVIFQYPTRNTLPDSVDAVKNFEIFIGQPPEGRAKPGQAKKNGT